MIIEKHIAGLGDFATAQVEMTRYRMEERLVAMTAKHATFISGYMAFVVHEEDAGWFGLLGRKSKNSVRTIIYALNVLIEPLVLSPRFPFGLIRKNTKYGIRMLLEKCWPT